MKIRGEAMSADTVVPKNIQQHLEKLLMKMLIYANKSLMSMRHPGGRRQNSKDKKLMPRSKAASNRLSLFFDGNASSDMDLKPLLVFHSENLRALKNVAKGFLSVVWKSDSKLWVTQTIFQDWFFHHFIPEIEKYSLEEDSPFNILLLLHSSPGHPNSWMAFIPK